MAMLEKRRKALAAEGLFDEDRKKPLPFLPRTIGVVTSPSGAVIRDILHRVAERFLLRVLVWPVAVQGEKCAPEVTAAIRGFAAAEGGLRPDVLIVARGGGSVEDLWGFNEEPVVRAVADCPIPVISAVGHETDTTLIDYAADRRAPTPTAAAEICVPVRGELAAQVADLQARRLRAVETALERRRQRLVDLTRALPRPEQMLAERRQRLDLAAARLPKPAQVITEKRQALTLAANRLGPALSTHAQKARLRLTRAVSGLQPARLGERIAQQRDRLSQRAERLRPATERARVQTADRLSALARMLGTLSYEGTIARGYAVVRNAEGQVLSRAEGIAPGTGLDLQFSDGHLAATAGEGASAPAAPKAASKPAKKAKKAPDDNQGSLF
jgi:exodeoxyribonuclease VII large subunit